MSEVVVGVSTGSSHPGDVQGGVELALRAEYRAVELSALAEAELPSVEAASQDPRLERFAHVSIHAPAKGRVMEEAQLVERLAACARPVVVHPDQIQELRVWRVLGEQLWLENLDGRARGFGAVGALDELLEALPGAGVCLDVSHAVHVGGIEHAVGLTQHHRERIRMLHVGCGCGEAVGPVLGAVTTGAVRAVMHTLGREVAVILERSVEGAGLGAKLDQQVWAVERACREALHQRR